MNFDWDPAGRMWVAETPEYPNGRRGMRPDYRGKEWKDHGGIDPTPGEQTRKAQDKISILTSSKGDGVMDTKQVFYEGLDLVTGRRSQRNDRFISGREALLVELGKHGLGERDLTSNINFFSKVTVDAQGGMSLAPGHGRAGDHVDLRFEMDCIVLLHAGPHPLDAGTRYAPPGVLLETWRSAPLAADDACLTRCPENARGYRNTTMHYLP